MRENIYGAAFVKSLERNMFTERDFSEMSASGEEEILAKMREHGYLGKDFSGMIENEERKVRKICEELCESRDVRDVMLAGDNFYNIKAALKQGISGWKHQNIFKLPADFDTDAFMLAAKTGDFKKLEGEFSGPAYQAYEEYRKTGIAGEIDECIDRLMIDYILEKSKGNRFVLGWARLYEEIAVKRKQLLAGYPEDADKQKELDDALTEYLKGAHYSFFSDDGIFAYFFGKKNELKNLRLIFYGIKSGNISDAKERLRMTYV